ncbi:hypothetical protein NL676_005058 [Syzygium grande]|nr:hypothetical protein NL676_005058 [Syzygium grande]
MHSDSNGFKSASRNLSFDRPYLIALNGACQLTHTSNNLSSRAFYKTPFHMLDLEDTSAALSYATTFIFAMLTGSHGLTFCDLSNDVFAIVFDIIQSLALMGDSDDNTSELALL